MVVEAPSSAAARWSKVQECLQRSMLPAEYATWIEPLQLVQLAGDEVVIAAPNVFVRDQVRSVYAQVLAECFASELGFPVQVELSIASAGVA